MKASSTYISLGTTTLLFTLYVYYRYYSTSSKSNRNVQEVKKKDEFVTETIDDKNKKEENEIKNNNHRNGGTLKNPSQPNEIRTKTRKSTIENEKSTIAFPWEPQKDLKGAECENFGIKCVAYSASDFRESMQFLRKPSCPCCV